MGTIHAASAYATTQIMPRPLPREWSSVQYSTSPQFAYTDPKHQRSCRSQCEPGLERRMLADNHNSVEPHHAFAGLVLVSAMGCWKEEKGGDVYLHPFTHPLRDRVLHTRLYL